MMLASRRRSFVALAMAVALALSSVAQASPAAAQLTFALRTTDGGEITSAMLRGDVVVMAFGASWLPLSRDQVRHVQELAEQYEERNVRVYWVSTDSEQPKSRNYATDAQLRDFARKNGLKVAVLRDPDGALFKQVGVPGNQLPAVVIIDRAGNVSGAPIGGLDPERKLVDVLGPRLRELLGSN